MSDKHEQADSRSSGGGPGADRIESMRSVLAEVDEPERYRLLARLFGELADIGVSGGLRGGAEAGEPLRNLSKKVQSLAEEKANLADVLATTRADLAHRTAQLDAERARADEQQRVIQDQRTRLETLQRERGELDTERVAGNAALHKAETERDRLQLQLQRAEIAGADLSRFDRLEAGRREAASEVERLRAAYEQLRLDKDAETERLKGDLSRSAGAGSQAADVMLTALWQRLASAKPPLVEGHIPPSVQAAERGMDALVELARFADDMDKSMRVFLDRYTKHHPSVKVPWEVYTQREDVWETARQTLAVRGGRPVGLLKMRLRVLYSWCQAAMIGADSAVESIASELQAQLCGPVGTQSDANRRIKDYIRDDGHYLFMERIRELRSLKLAETYGRGG